MNKPKKPKLEKRKEPLDFEQLNKNIEKCQYCNQLFHPSGLPKHELYCSKNPNAKQGYETKRKWQCRYCEALFLHQKERDLHEACCENTIESNQRDAFDRLRDLKRLFPEIYLELTNEQIKAFLDGKP